MKTFKKILIIICVIIIAVGMFMLGRQGLNYVDGYTQSLLLDTVEDYVLYIGISIVVILVYLMARYSKQGIIKVAITSILSIVGAVALVIAIMAIIRMQVNRIFFPIMLVTYVCSIIAVSSYFESNT